MKERVMGMVLSAATIGEYDKRIVLLTRERGRISAFARGARRPRSPLSASTEPFNFGEFYIYHGRDSYSVEQVEVKNFFPELRKDLDDLYIPSLPDKLVRYIYEFRMLSIEGEAPRIFECMRCGGTDGLHHFFVRESGIVCEGCYPELSSLDRQIGITLSETTVYTLQRILSSPVEKLYTFTVGDNILAELEQVVGRYFKAHTDREFKALI